jgi:predicted DNA-binding transcriptional regulator AlpA
MTTQKPPRLQSRAVYRENDLRRQGICESNSTLLRWEASGHFPRRIHLGLRAKAWIAAEVDAFIADRAAARGEVSHD